MKRLCLALVSACAVSAPLAAQEVNTSALSENGWFSDDTRADGSGSEGAGTNLVSDTLTDDPEASATGTSAHDADILGQIIFGDAIGAEPVGTYGGAVHLLIDGGGAGKSQISHRKDDAPGHGPGSAFGPGFTAEYSWMGDGTPTVTASLKFGIRTADFGSTGSSSRTGENVWDKVLIYEPGNLNGGTSDGSWQTETIDYTTGRWWFFDRTAGASIIGMPMTLSDMSTSTFVFDGGSKTVQDVYNLIMGGVITSVQFGIGSGNAGGSVYVNQLECSAYRAGMTTTFGSPSPYDQDITPDVIFGSGNANGSWTVDRQNGLELGLRAKVRFPVPMNVFNSNGDGTYTFVTGAGGSGSPTPLWSFEWAANTDYDNSSGMTIDDLTYELGMDFDPAYDTNYLIFDNISPGSIIPWTPPSPPVPFWDHAIGDNSTPNGGGTSAGDAPTYLSLIANNNVVQNSWRMDFFDEVPFDIFDPDVPGRYEFYLKAFDTGVEVGRTAITVIVADGATMALEADPCQVDQSAAPGLQIAVNLYLRNPDESEVTAFQAFLEFDDSSMTYEGALSSYANDVFNTHIQPIATAEVAAGELRLDGNTFSATGSTDDELLATLIFTVSECDPVGVDFDTTQPFPSEVSFDGTALVTDLWNSPSIVADVTPPSITCPADIVQTADAGVGNGCESAVVTWADPVATDSCDSSVDVVCVPPSGSVFPAGVTTTVTCTATDDCGNTDVCTFDVTVTLENTVWVDIQLVGAPNATTRCITFVPDDCTDGVDIEIPFDSSGAFSGPIEVPCGNWTQLCAKDEQHTKWFTGDLEVMGADYVLTAGTPVLNLRAGDTDNDGDVDVNDVTLLIAQFGGPEPAGGCPWDGTRGADFNNDGIVDAVDYSLLVPEWLTLSSCACMFNPLPGVHFEAVSTAVLTSELDPWIAARADLNKDGIVDSTDVRMFEKRHRLSSNLSESMERLEKFQKMNVNPWGNRR